MASRGWGIDSRSKSWESGWEVVVAVTFQRVLSDDELHRRVRAAVGSGTKVYERVGSDRDIGRIATRFSRDENAQRVLRTFIEDVVAASGRLKQKPNKRHRLRNVILISSAVAAASGRLTEKPKKRHRLRNVILLGSAVGAGGVVVIRRRRGRDGGIPSTMRGCAPAESPTPASGSTADPAGADRAGAGAGVTSDAAAGGEGTSIRQPGRPASDSSD